MKLELIFIKGRVFNSISNGTRRTTCVLCKIGSFKFIQLNRGTCSIIQKKQFAILGKFYLLLHVKFYLQQVSGFKGLCVNITGVQILTIDPKNYKCGLDIEPDGLWQGS